MDARVASPLACLLAGLALPAAAHAATAGGFGQSYFAAAGESNQLSIGSSNSLKTLRYTDTGAGVAAGGNCVSVDLHNADCSYGDAQVAFVTLGDMNDSASWALYGLPVYIDAGTGNDQVNGGSSDDHVSGGPGNDLVDGGSGKDVIDDYFGDYGLISASGEGGNDTESGGAGDDTIIARSGADTIIGGADFDTVDYSARTAPLHVSVDTGNIDDGAAGEGDTVTSVERVLGGSGADVLISGATGSTLVGGAGDDTLTGGAGADLLRGDDLAGSAGSGNDTLDGGKGADELRGGDGTDTATYASRAAGVSVTPDDVADDGEAGEQDNVRSDVEQLVGGAGNDVFGLRDGRAETVTCGAGADAVVADAADVVAADCETVDRPAVATVPAPGDGTGTTPTPPPAPSPALLTITSKTLKADRHGRVTLKLSCAAGSGGCAGTLKLRRGSAGAGSAVYVIAAGRSATLRLTLSSSTRRALRHRRSLALSASAAPVIGAFGRAASLTLKR